jgi:hypothetical protein
MTQCSQTTPNEEPVNVQNCRMIRMGQYIEVCMANSTCTFAEAYPQNLKLCVHPLRNKVPIEDIRYA